MSWDDEDFDESNIVIPSLSTPSPLPHEDEDEDDWEKFDENSVVIPDKNTEQKASWSDEDKEEDEPTPTPPTVKAPESNEAKPKKDKKSKKKKAKAKSKGATSQNQEPEEDALTQKLRLDKLVQEMDFENAKEMFSGLDSDEPPKVEEPKKEEPKKAEPAKAKELPRVQKEVRDYDDEDEDDEEDYETLPKSNTEKPKLQAKAKAKTEIQADINIEATVADLVKKLKPVSAHPQFFRCYKSLIQSATKSLSADEMKEISKVFTNASNAKIVQQSDKKKKAAKPVRQQLNIREKEDDVYEDLF